MLGYLRRLVFIVYCLLDISLPSAIAGDVPKKLDVDEAEQLAYKALSGHRPRPPGTLWYEPDISLPFFTFSGAAILAGIDGYWAVNPWTGDVWDLWGCTRPTTPALHRALTDIRHRFTAEERKQYRKLRRLKPVCEWVN
jgi:hypothetical protein